MSNYLLSKPVLDAILETEREQGTYQNTIGEVALEVMDSVDRSSLSELTGNANRKHLEMKVVSAISFAWEI
jgi:hypothetical protein